MFFFLITNPRSLPTIKNRPFRSYRQQR